MRFPFSKVDTFLLLICFASAFYYILTWSNYSPCAAPIQIFLVAAPFTLILMTIIFHLFRAYARITRIRRYFDFLIILIFTPFSLYLSVQGIIWQIIICLKSLNQYCPTGYFQIPWFWVTLLLGVGFRYVKISHMMVKAYWLAHQVRRRIRAMQQSADNGDYQAIMGLGNANNDMIGLLPVDIERLEKKHYKPNLQENGENCAICLVEFNAEDKVITLPKCEHTFHSECVVDWLKKKPLCPMCRGNVINGMADIESQVQRPPSNIVENA